MPTPVKNSAQRELVHQLINWELIESRCECYPAIGRTFPLEVMKKHSESPPYYCHYMSWRLGTYNDVSPFQRLEELLCCSELLPNWEEEIEPFINSSEFASYWSLIWQLQVAEHLCKVGKNVQWAKTGSGTPAPDLSVEIGDKRWFVECYATRKSFGLLRFLDELVTKLDPAVRTSYDLCLPFSLPAPHFEQDRFLDEILKQTVDPDALAKAKKNAESRYPAVLYEHAESSLVVWVEGDDCDAYMPGIIPNQTGDPKTYVECVLKEAVDAKKNSNDLTNHHPNLLAVSLLLSEDFQLAVDLSHRLKSLCLPQIQPNVDVLAVSTIGIDERLTKGKLNCVVRTENEEHSGLNKIVSQSPAFVG